MDPFAFDFGQGMHGPGQSTANVPTPRTRLPDDPLPRATAESPEPLETLRNVEFLHRLPGLLPLDVSQLQQSSNSLSNRPSSRSRAVQRSIPSATIPPPTMADIASLFTSDMEDLSDDHNDDNSVSLHTASHSSLYGSDDNEDDDKGALTDLSLLSDEEVSRVNKVRVPRLPNGLGGRGRGRRRKRRSHRYSFQSRQKSQKTLGAGSIGQTPKNKSSPMHGGAPTPTNSTGPKHPRTTPFGHSTGSFTPHLNRPKPPFSSSLLLPPNPFTKRGEDKLKDERALNNDLDEIVKSRSVTFETVEVDQTEVVSETEKNDDNDDMPISPTHKGVKSTSDPDSKPHHSARLGLIDSTTKRTSSRTLQKPTPQLQPETHSQSAQELSDDNCAVCLGKGKLICCDSCVRVFHLGCLKEVLDEGALPDFWECWRCRGNRRRRKVKSPELEEVDELETGLDPHQMSRSTTTTTRRTQQPRTLFTPLLESLLSLNPRLFSLPVDIYGSFESLVAHPLTGDFINTDETELLDASVPYLWAQKVNPSLKRKQPPGTTDLTNGSNGVTDTSISGQFCYKCSKTTHTHSHSPLLKCDFCPLLWHTDCLSPPLSTHPPELRADEIEMINLRVVRGLKGRIWGRDGVPFDQNTTRGLGDGPSVVSVRRKWMCPCHSSWAIHDSDSDRSVKKWKGAWRVVDVYDPGTEGVDDADGSSGTDQDVYMFRSKSTSNLGNIEITAATDDDEAFTRHSDLTSRLTQPTKTDAFSVNGVLFRVPEHRLKLDFLRKTRSSSPSSNTVFPRPGSRHTVLGNGQVAFEEGVLGVMFPGFDAGYTSNIGSLFTGTDEQDECEEETGLDVLVDAAQAVEQTNACQENDINMSRDDKDVEEWISAMAEFGRQVSDRLARRRRERERVSSVGPTRKMNEGSSSIVKEM